MTGRLPNPQNPSLKLSYGAKMEALGAARAPELQLAPECRATKTEAPAVRRALG